MPQPILPLFCDGVTEINTLLSYKKENGFIYYFHGTFPIFNHAEEDTRSFRMFTSQLIANGLCRNIDIQKAFGICKISVCRALKKLEEGGVEAFFKKKATRGATVMTAGVIEDAQRLLDEGYSRSDTAAELGIKKDTLSKAILARKLRETKKKAVNSKL